MAQENIPFFFILLDICGNRDRSPIRPERQAGRGRGRGRGRGARRGARSGPARRRQDPAEPNIDWSDQYSPVQIPDFGEPHPGPTRRFPNVNTARERDFFDLLFTNDIWEILVQETNRYYDQQKATDPGKHKRPWAPVTRDEMEAFIGMIILMGIVKLPRFEMYWSQDKLIHQESIANIMSQTRFLQIWRYFHLADNAVAIPRGTDGFDKIYRVRNFLNIILINIRDEYRLGMNIAIDETMVPHKGKLAFKQYIKNKPTKWGIKLWVLSEATTGYVYRFQVYLGKEHGQQPEKHLARRVVRDLTVTETGKNHHLYMDNFYTDPHFFLELFDKKILACGTVRQNRKQFPKDLIITTRMQKQMDRGDYLWRAHMRLVATAWNDRRVVYHLSTIHPPDLDGQPATIKRKSARGGNVDINCPPAQLDYQKYMGGVDLADQLIKTFSVIRKSRKAWKKLFGYGLEVCLLDSFIIMKKLKPSNTEFLTYRKEVARQLIAGRSFRGKAGRPPTQPQAEVDARRLDGSYHEIAVTDARRDCVVCAKRAQVRNLDRNYRYKSAIVCTTCDGKALCLNKDRNCWEKWHRQVQYWQ